MSTHALHETAALTRRSLRHVLRSPDTIVTTAVMPIAFLLLFVYVFGGAIEAGVEGPAAGSSGGEAYVDYLLPGILLITIATGVAYTAYRVFMDLQGGMVERLRSMPISRAPVLWAHVLTSLAAILTSLVVVVGVAVLMGFRSEADLIGWLAVTGILVLVALVLTWLAVIAGLSARSLDGATAFSYPLIFLPFLSSAFVPTATMPGPVRWFAEHQPVTSVVDSLRALLAGEPVGGEIWVALAWCVGALVLAYTVAVVLFRRRVG